MSLLVKIIVLVRDLSTVMIISVIVEELTLAEVMNSIITTFL